MTELATLEGRGATLEQENQALRDQVADLQQLLQLKDTEIALKYRLLQTKERESVLARARLQWIEACLPQLLAADAEKAASTFSRHVLLRWKGAVKATDKVEDAGV